MKKRHHLILLAIFLAVMQVQAADESKKLRELKSLNRDIVLLNLVNGLHLTDTQMQTLIEKIETAEMIRARFETSLEAGIKERMKVLNELKSVLIEDSEVPLSLNSRIREMEKAEHTLKNELGENLVQLELDITNMLTENQHIIIRSFKPCKIPPAQGRIGQSAEAAAAGIAKKLSHIRKLSQNTYERLLPMFVEKHIDRIEILEGLLSEDEKQMEEHKFRQVLETARHLNDQAFLVQKGELAQTLLPPEKSDTRKLKKYQLTRTGLFLLDPALLPILEAKLKA